MKVTVKEMLGSHDGRTCQDYNPFTGSSTPFTPFVNKIPMEEDNYVSLAHTYQEEIVLDSDIASDPTQRTTQNPNFTILP